jgi:hypothetical protein
MKLLTPLALLSFLPLAISSSEAPPSVTIDSFIYNGSGCPQGSLDAYVSNGGTQISVSYSQMVAFSPNDSLSAKRKFCQFNFKLHYPPGWALTVVANEFDGYVNIDAGMTAEVVSSYYFSGEGGGGESDVSYLICLSVLPEVGQLLILLNSRQRSLRLMGLITTTTTSEIQRALRCGHLAGPRFC